MTVEKIRFSCDTVEEAIEKMYDQKDYLYNKIVENLTYGYENDILKMPMMEVLVNSKPNYFTIISHRDKWISLLNKAMTYFIHMENYEKCDSIKKLITKIQE